MTTFNETMPEEAQLLQAMTDVLEQGLDLLEKLDASDYNRPIPEAFNATIGQHYRHCLEHFQPILEPGTERIDYDARAREAAMETDPVAANERTRQILEACSSLETGEMQRPIAVRCKVAYGDAKAPSVQSTLGRECMFAVSHAIHHYALIAVMAGITGLRLPEPFGIAPSTVAHRN